VIALAVSIVAAAALVGAVIAVTAAFVQRLQQWGWLATVVIAVSTVLAQGLRRWRRWHVAMAVLACGNGGVGMWQWRCWHSDWGGSVSPVIAAISLVGTIIAAAALVGAAIAVIAALVL
jgi:hypothetical protein